MLTFHLRKKKLIREIYGICISDDQYQIFPKHIPRSGLEKGSIYLLMLSQIHSGSYLYPPTSVALFSIWALLQEGVRGRIFAIGERALQFLLFCLCNLLIVWDKCAHPHWPWGWSRCMWQCMWSKRFHLWSKGCISMRLLKTKWKQWCLSSF